MLLKFAKNGQRSGFRWFSGHHPVILSTPEEVQVFKANMTIFIRQAVFISSGSPPHFHFIFYQSDIFCIFSLFP